MASKTYLNRTSSIQNEEIKQGDIEMIDTTSHQKPETIQATIVADQN